MILLSQIIQVLFFVSFVTHCVSLVLNFKSLHCHEILDFKDQHGERRSDGGIGNPTSLEHLCEERMTRGGNGGAKSLDDLTTNSGTKVLAVGKRSATGVDLPHHNRKAVLLEGQKPIRFGKQSEKRRRY